MAFFLQQDTTDNGFSSGGLLAASEGGDTRYDEQVHDATQVKSWTRLI